MLPTPRLVSPEGRQVQWPSVYPSKLWTLKPTSSTKPLTVVVVALLNSYWPEVPYQRGRAAGGGGWVNIVDVPCTTLLRTHRWSWVLGPDPSLPSSWPQILRTYVPTTKGRLFSLLRSLLPGSHVDKFSLSVTSSAPLPTHPLQTLPRL